ncbi:MAG: hypothetical protein DCF29_15590 [Alphaproteobacteria bacterium]|nr:MAG: hypothetical protein DCF29_15590 [Alphaproteobacteria bacterium]
MGIQLAKQPRDQNTASSRQNPFATICDSNDIEQWLTRPNHPWINGQVEGINSTIKQATLNRFHFGSHDQRRTHLAVFMAADNSVLRLQTLSGLTPYKYIANIWISEHLSPGAPHNFESG